MKYKYKNIVALIVSVLLSVGIVIVIILRIPRLSCCMCPIDANTGYKLYPIVAALVENRWMKLVDCHCPTNVGCRGSFFVIPVDLIVGLVVSVVFMVWFVNLRRKR